MRLTRALMLGVIAGAIAGTALGVYYTFAAEPLIDRAICYEQTGQPECTIEEGEVARVYQRIVLFLGSPLLGVALGALFALIYSGFHPYLPGRTTRGKAIGLALIGFFLFPLLPSTRLPPLPPGVANTVATPERDLWYALIVIGGLAGVVAGLALYKYIARDGATSRKVAGGIGSLLLVAGISSIAPLLYGGSTLEGSALSDPDLLLQFRIVSVAGMALLWLVLGSAFARLRGRSETPLPTDGSPEPVG